MPPLASLAASLLVASPPPAACGPPCLSRQRRRKPSLPSAYPQPTLSLPSNAFPSRSRRRRACGESARRLAAPGGLRPPMPLQATEEEAQPARSLSSAYPQPTL